MGKTAQSGRCHPIQEAGREEAGVLDQIYLNQRPTPGAGD